MEDFKEMLIHATRAARYRFMKATNGADENFGDFKVHAASRSPAQIVNHMVDLANKTKQMIAEGNFDCASPGLLPFLQEKERLLDGLEALEALMRESKIAPDTAKRLLQGPILDMVSHAGQLAMLNGMNGNKVAKESYYDAEI